jgi:hypothetical protein
MYCTTISKWQCTTWHIVTMANYFVKHKYTHTKLRQYIRCIDGLRARHDHGVAFLWCTCSAHLFLICYSRLSSLTLPLSYKYGRAITPPYYSMYNADVRNMRRYTHRTSRKNVTFHSCSRDLRRPLKILNDPCVNRLVIKSKLMATYIVAWGRGTWLLYYLRIEYTMSFTENKLSYWWRACVNKYEKMSCRPLILFILSSAVVAKFIKCRLPPRCRLWNYVSIRYVRNEHPRWSECHKHVRGVTPVSRHYPMRRKKCEN